MKKYNYKKILILTNQDLEFSIFLIGELSQHSNTLSTER
jgi:hypothetical protein